MVESGKKNPISGGAFISDILSVMKNRTTVAFAYGFMFAFVIFTVFLAFNPSPNSASPWFSNIFNFNSSSSILTAGSNFTASQSPVRSEEFPENITSTEHSVSDNQTRIAVPLPHANQSATGISPEPPVRINQTQELENLNSNTSSTPAANQIPNSPVESSEKGGETELVVGANDSTPAPVPEKPKEENNVGDSGAAVEQGIDDFIQSLMNCDLFDGNWVYDDSYPLYKPGSCSTIDEQFNCIVNGRPDSDFQRMKWKPKGCTLPRLNGTHMLELLRGKRLAFVGDSLNRNMWESLICILKSAVKDPKNVYEANGRSYFRGEASYSFIFKDYNFTVEFFVSPFLVREGEWKDKNGTKETLRLDVVGKSADHYRGADILIFNTGHWWTHEKTSKGKDYYQERNRVYGELNVLEAFRKALTTWARWVDANVNPMKSMVFFRGYSETHFRGGQWNAGGACDNETDPIKNEAYLIPYPSKMLVLEKVLSGMRTHVTYLNITRLTDFRKDGHPSIYRKQKPSAEEKRTPLLYQDCSHWCLPGVPDAWNELLYAELLVKESKMQQHQAKKSSRSPRG